MSIELGKFNQLEVVKEVDFGVYLDGGEEGEILLPTRYVPEDCKIGDFLNVFLYLDMDERLIATTLTAFLSTDNVPLLLKPQYGNSLHPHVHEPRISVQLLNVFLYLDMDERLIATTLTPLVQVGQFACLEVSWKNIHLCSRSIFRLFFRQITFHFC